jgi:hypothetical protein
MMGTIRSEDVKDATSGCPILAPLCACGEISVMKRGQNEDRIMASRSQTHRHAITIAFRWSLACAQAPSGRPDQPPRKYLVTTNRSGLFGMRALQGERNW